MQDLEYVKIESIECVGEGHTYDIEMEGWPSFVANGIVVHNSGMKKLLKEMAMGGQLTFDDLAAATALFRPGPLDAGLCDRYVRVKQGAAKPYYEHPALEKCLGDTFGVIVYQESVMQIAKELSGFTAGESDLMRKAIGKKSMELMKTMSEQFVEGAAAGYAEVETDDGRVLRVHRKRKLKCSDGKLRTIDEALADEADVVESL